MTFSMSPTSSTVAIVGTVTASYQRNGVVKASGTQPGVGTTDVATVSAGKTAYLVGFVFNVACNAGATPYDVALKDSDGNTFFSLSGNATANSAIVPPLSMFFLPGSEPSLAATKKFQIVNTTANTTGKATVYYYEA